MMNIVAKQFFVINYLHHNIVIITIVCCMMHYGWCDNVIAEIYPTTRNIYYTTNKETRSALQLVLGS